MLETYLIHALNIEFEFDRDNFTGYITYPNGNKRKIKTTEILSLFVLINLKNIKPL